MSYRLINASSLDTATAETITRFAWERTPGGIERSTAIKIGDGDTPSGRAMRGTSRPKWAGRATWAVRAAYAPSYFRIGHATVCWHSTHAKRHVRDRLDLWLESERDRDKAWQFALADFLDEIDRRYRAGDTHYHRWPIYFEENAEQALLHTLAHELMHVLAYDRDRETQSELLCEEHACRVLEAWKQEEARRAA